MAESEEELKSLMMRMKEETEKAGLKLNTQNTMTSVPITLCQIEGEKVEAVTGFIFLGSKITVDGDYTHEIKRPLLLGRKVMTNLRQHMKKQRHLSANKGPYSQRELDHKRLSTEELMLSNCGAGEDS